MLGPCEQCGAPVEIGGTCTNQTPQTLTIDGKTVKTTLQCGGTARSTGGDLQISNSVTEYSWAQN